ncbi:MAG: polyphosphate kinase 1 [Gemmatimonadaceae bacterium]|nr:polyphosphate kinase 1 [Gemmatimonadaceae bacterium]
MTLPPLPDVGDDGRWDVPSVEVFKRLTTATGPLDLRITATHRAFHRDVYFDSDDGSLQGRGVSCLVRHDSEGRHRLLVTIVSEHDGAASLRHVMADLPGGDERAGIGGDSEPARLLRSIVNPAWLAPTLELEVERLTRLATAAGWWRPARFALAYDTITVRASGLARAFHELSLHVVKAGRPTRDDVGSALRDSFALRSLTLDRRHRGEQLRDALESEALARRVGSGRWVAVVAIDGTRVAVLREGAGWKLPITEGSGEDACRHLMRRALGTSVGDLHLLATTTGEGRLKALEIWTCTRVDQSTRSVGAGSVAWLPVEEVLARIGTPEIADTATLAALTTLARSDVLHRLVSTPLSDTGPRVPPVRRPEATTRETLALLDGDASLLAFNTRVLAVAQDERTPLLERLRYVAIVASNLDEFYAVRAGRLKYDGDTASDESDGSGLEARRARLARDARGLVQAQYACAEDVLDALAPHGVVIRQVASVSERALEHLRGYFRASVFPLLTPRAITATPGHSLPIVADRTLCFAVILRDATDGRHLAELTVPPSLPRFVALPDGEGFVAIEDVVRSHLALLYPGRRVEHSWLFRVTRYADLELDEQRAGNLVQAIDEQARERRHRPIVRVEVERAMPYAVREMLLRELALEPGARPGALGTADLVDIPGLMALDGLRQLTDLPIATLGFPPFAARDPVAGTPSLWAAIRESDILLHHPYDDFSASVVRFFDEAADDPDVMAIKVALYRTGERSPIAEALRRAAESGKDVAVFVELKARFDEERNVRWTRRLQAAGVHVVHGLPGYKNHSKVALVVRREGSGTRRYAHVGTGNYNAGTARVYTDLGLLTAREDVCDDLTDLFNTFTGSSAPADVSFRVCLVAPNSLLPGLLARIHREAGHARAGRSARIRMKLNGLADREVIRALYDAAAAGVTIDLVVRGICTLRPGERLRVTSIIGRFLEHARIYVFDNGGEAEYFIGSADLRPRNLRRRVEVLVPVASKTHRERLDGILSAELADSTAWSLGADGTWARVATDGGSAQARFMSQAVQVGNPGDA